MRVFKFFAKLSGNHILMTNFYEFRKYQTFGLVELHNLSKGQLAYKIFRCVFFFGLTQNVILHMPYLRRSVGMI